MKVSPSGPFAHSSRLQAPAPRQLLGQRIVGEVKDHDAGDALPEEVLGEMGRGGVLREQVVHRERRAHVQVEGRHQVPPHLVEVPVDALEILVEPLQRLGKPLRVGDELLKAERLELLRRPVSGAPEFRQPADARLDPGFLCLAVLPTTLPIVSAWMSAPIFSMPCSSAATRLPPDRMSITPATRTAVTIPDTRRIVSTSARIRGIIPTRSIPPCTGPRG